MSSTDTATAHALLSPSKAERWLNCTKSPRLEAEMPDSASEYAQEGRLAHKVCELAASRKFRGLTQKAYNATLKKLKTDPLWNDEMLTTANQYVEHLYERAMAFQNPPYVTLEVRVDISHYVPEAFGTCDCVMIGGDNLIITDYKHGKGVPVKAENNPQMMLYALGALSFYKPVFGDKIRMVWFYIDQPRLGVYEGHGLDVEELLAWGKDVVEPKAALAYVGQGEYVPGDWCRFCRAKAVCRARADNFTALEDFIPFAPPIPGAIPGDGRDIINNAEVGDLLIRGAALTDWYNSLKEYALSTILQGEAIPGWKAVEGRSTRAWSDQDKALETIINHGFDRAVVYDAVPKSLAQLEKLLGATKFSEWVADLVVKPPGKPALVPESDKRPPYSGAVADFTEVSSV